MIGRVLTDQYNRFYDAYLKPLYMPASDTLLPVRGACPRPRRVLPRALTRRLAWRRPQDQDPSMKGRYTVVIDLENTLVSSTWDVRLAAPLTPPTQPSDPDPALAPSPCPQRKYGWRSVKRPGADDLLAFLSQHCEVVLFSDKDHGMGSDTAMKLDPGQMLFHHQLHREYTRWMNGRLVKVRVWLVSGSPHTAVAAAGAHWLTHPFSSPPRPALRT